MASDEQGNGDGLYEEIERRALFSMSGDEQAEELDVLDVLKGEAAAQALDMTLGGYIDVHDRVPAFEGSDGQPYTVDVDAEETGRQDQRFAAFLVFIRWAATGAGIMDHVESGDVAYGDDEAAARQAAMDLSLYEVKAELDAAIERRRQRLED
jgi:hypothetical protein